MAGSLSFFACLHGLQRLGSFFHPFSWKKAFLPEVQMKNSLQSTHLMLRSGCSESCVVSSSWTSSRCDMMRSPRVVDVSHVRRGHSEAVQPCSKRSRCFPGEFRGERWLALEQAKRMVESITMAKLCQG